MMILLEKDNYIYVGDRGAILPIEKSKIHSTLANSELTKIDVAQVDGNTDCCKISTLLKKSGGLSRRYNEPIIAKGHIQDLPDMGSMTINGSCSGKIKAYKVCMRSPGGKEEYKDRLLLWFSNWDECIVLDNPDDLKNIKHLFSGKNIWVFYLGRDCYEWTVYWYPMFLDDKRRIAYLPDGEAGSLIINIVWHLVKKGKTKVKTYYTPTRSLRDKLKAEGTLSWVYDEVGNALLEMLNLTNEIDTRFRTRIVDGVLEIYFYTDYDRSVIQSKTTVPLNKLVF